MHLQLKSMSVIALGSAMTLSAVDADAYCRSTTCTTNCARDVDGCKTKGHKLYWKSQCISFSVQEDGSEHIDKQLVRDIITKSFVEWSDRSCEDGSGVATMAFSALDDADCHAAEYNEDGPNANIILFQDTKWQYSSVDNTLAKTTVTYDNDTGEILDADIEINHAYNEYTTDDEVVVYDLQSILTHEIGHFIGLDHTPDFAATMNAGYQEGTIELRTLESDDIDGLCAAYPPGRDAKCNTTPKGGFTTECAAVAEEDGCSIVAGEPKGQWGWFLALGASMVIVRRRRDMVRT